ncbi:hypothetical protein QTO34_007471 [Cnephaeus nilssonii]|uniref:Uncharacterized protein n=1 Tax=Cnephaeus nilssonii TaxID=3371016 RepID=A0AA40HID7_CNENI|nr:hypothetical protein QTO34_007471 [Eptesicus nilssonii]
MPDPDPGPPGIHQQPPHSPWQALPALGPRPLLQRAPPGQAPQEQQLLPVHAAAAQRLRARVLPGHAVEGGAALPRLLHPRQLRPREPGAESGDVGLPSVRRGRGAVDHDLVAAAAPPGAEPHTRHLPLLHPGPHRVPGPHAPGLRAPGAQL